MLTVCVSCSKENSGITWVCNRDNEYTYINEHGKIKCEYGKHIGRYYVYYPHSIHVLECGSDISK